MWKSVTQINSAYAGGSRDHGSREALLTQHASLYLLNMLKVPFQKFSLRI